MADKIKVNTADMQQTISKYNNSRQTMEQARRKMAQALQNLNGCWKGLAWAAMMAKWEEINANINKSELAIDRSIASLSNTINLYNAGEDQVGSKANALSTGNKTQIFVS